MTLIIIKKINISSSCTFIGFFLSLKTALKAELVNSAQLDATVNEYTVGHILGCWREPWGYHSSNWGSVSN